MKTRLFIEKVIRSTLSVFLVLLVAIATWQVVSRYFLNDPAQFTDEALRYIMIWMTFIAAPYAFGLTDKHMSLNIIKDKFTGNKRRTIEILNSLLVIGFIIYIMIYGGWKLVSIGIGSYSDSMQIPLSYVYSVMPISGILSVYFKICNLNDVLKSISSDKEGEWTSPCKSR
ncbi:TRAP transporter small permease [Vibrio sp. MEBiC08052]|uniref:TRAP transporter small permease n=1 Tax=Vibrio sp. MEBiC08052 TaxID=1761910 RepID=UPI00074080AF|nr:TRAP transporter small permease [Vibrio sp. MEBiC08052]KUI97910.1 hypothetical protein VRK_26110 [Vibrio sp. MEBiC08052]